MKKGKPDYAFIKNLVKKINEDLNRSHQFLVETSVLPEAKLYAEKNWPAANELSIEPFVTTFKGQYNALKKDVSMRMQGGMQKILGTAAMVALNERINTITEAIRNEINRCKNLNSDRCRIIVHFSKKVYRFQKLLLFLFGIAESLLNISCFLGLGDIVIIAAIVGTIIGLAQIYAVKTTVLFIREMTDPQKQKLYLKIALAGFTVVSLVLGAIRYYLAHTGTATNMPFVVLNPFTFVTFNMMFVIATALLVFFYFPSKSETNKLEQIEEIDDQIKKINLRREKLEYEHNDLLYKRQEIIKVHGEIIHDEQKLHEKIDLKYDEAIGTFKSENVSKRTDGKFPECFKHPHTPLSDNTDTNTDDFSKITT